MSGAEWELQPSDPSTEERLQAELGVSGLVARLLVQRGYGDPESAEKFLNPRLSDLHDPRLLPDFDAAVKEILSARDEKRRIFIHGDYDVDGITSASLLSRFLRRIGAEVTTHVPHRMKEGYGINISAVEKAREAGASLFLTCDCGSGAIEQIKLAKAYGMRVVITDHHELHDEMPEAEAFVNVHREGHAYPFDGLSGVGVAFKLCAGIAREAGFSLDQYYRAFLDLTALGTVADVMPLVDENRIIVAHGCQRVQESNKAGIKAILEHVKVRGKLTPRTIGFQIGPRLNAAGRIDDAALPLKLLLSEDMDEAREIAGQLEAINTTRREEQDRIIEEAKARVLAEGLDQETAIVIGSDDWHPGIIGLVAGRLAESFYRPAFVMTFGPDGKAKGSARTIPGYHLADALKRVTEHLETHGGHELAAGFSAKQSNVEAFRLAMQQDATSTIPPEMLIRRRKIDVETTVEECNLSTMHELERMAPFGAGNPEPTFVARHLKVERINPLPNKPQHVKMLVRSPGGQSVEALGFGMGERLAELAVGERVSLVFQPSISTWGNRETVEWTIMDLARES